MGIETGTYISDLVITNPVGATDPKSAGDDHIRLLKATIKATFANITGAVTASHTELNNLAGVTGKTGTGNVVLSAGPTLTGTVTAATVAATTLTGAGSGITALNASNLASGTVPDARFPATLPAASAANLTAIPAANVTGSHTLPDGVLSTNVPLLDAANQFSTGQVFKNAGTAVVYMYDTSAGTNEKLWAGMTVTATQFGLASTYTDGGSAVANALLITRSATTITEIDLAATTLSFAGNVSTPHTSVSEVGYQGIPPVTLSGATTLDNSYNGKLLYVTSSSADITFPTSLLPGFSCVIVNNSGSGSIQLKRSSTGLFLPGTAFGSNADRTLIYGGMVTVTNFAGVNFMVSGIGVS